MGSPRRRATTPTASVPKRATAIQKKNERDFFISVEHCGESSARAQSQFLVQSFLVQSCPEWSITVPDRVAVSICAKLTAPIASQQRTRKQERAARAKRRPKSGHQQSLLIDRFASAPSMH